MSLVDVLRDKHGEKAENVPAWNLLGEVRDKHGKSSRMSLSGTGTGTPYILRI